jgi:hypothetical protein
MVIHLGDDYIVTFYLQISRSELDAKYAYIQVTHVTPYFEKLELEERQTEFEQSHDIKCFMFETPFTKDGKARGTPEDQWKRRTILTSNLEAFFQQLLYLLKKTYYTCCCFT